jgi:predicted DCC family thiol-disulfide oxidoreductase YuxK
MMRCAVQSEKPSLRDRKRSDSKNASDGGRMEQDHPGDAYFAVDKRPIILFDGVCNLCNGGVNFMLDHDPKGNLRFTALQSEAGRALLQRANRSTDDLTSIVLVEPNKIYIRSEAILHIAQYLHQPLITFGKLGLFVPGFIRDRFYNLIAYNRYSIMGKRQMCRIGDSRFNDRFVN